MINFLRQVLDVFCSIVRLLILEFVLFFSGLNHILFNKSEITSLTLQIIPQKREREKLSYLSELKYSNFDIDLGIPLAEPIDVNFKSDDEIMSEGEEPDDDDLDDDDDNGTEELK